MLEVKNLRKSFNNILIWDNLSSSFSGGEIVSIQGKSGEGKTTFLRCLNDLDVVDGGDIKIDGEYLCRTVDNKAEYCSERLKKMLHSKISMVFQGFNLFPHLSIIDNLTLAPNYHRLGSPDENRRQALKWLERMDLSDKADSYPHQLSGGQMQRTAIARACMLNPKILCFDEPTSALDEDSARQVEHIIRKLAAGNMCVIIVTHDRSFAMRISNRILHIEDGCFREELLT